MRLHPGEPEFAHAEVVTVDDLLGRLLPNRTGPSLLAIDGRSASGKSSLATHLGIHADASAVVHTDDIAWWHSRFGWDDLLVEGIIRPLHEGADVSYRPPQWDTRKRPGAITVPADATLVIIEGVGSARRSLHGFFDAVIWVQTDLAVANSRDAARVAAGEVDQANYDGWMEEEIPFQAAERTWERADVVVSGTGDVPYDRDHEVVLLR